MCGVGVKKLSPRQLYERTLTENDVLGAIRSILELNGAHVDRIVERIPWGKTTSTPGIPDLVAWWRRSYSFSAGVMRCCPTVAFIEVKRPGGKLRPAQAAWLEAAQRDGVIAFKAESVEEMVAEFKKHGIQIRGLQC